MSGFSPTLVIKDVSDEVRICVCFPLWGGRCTVLPKHLVVLKNPTFMLKPYQSNTLTQYKLLCYNSLLA